MELGMIGAFAVGLVALYFVAKLITLPAKLIMKLIYNGVIGGIMLWALNLVGGIFGFTIGINVVSALIAGFLGVPGVVLLIIWKLLGN